ncbi:MAG: DUF559 domain-containing protein [Deltaproteobacteria bacterium]
MGEFTTGNSVKKLFIPQPVPAPLLEAARNMRKGMTDAKQLLWFCLRRKQIGGFRFRRQHPFERFALDFYCCEAKLAMELDGGHHNEVGVHARDNERTAILEHHGIKVIRFWNNEVFRNMEGVLQTIYDTLLERTTKNPLPDPPPLGEGNAFPHFK